MANPSHLSAPEPLPYSKPLGLLRIARPKQWIKNGYLFAALVFSKHLLDMPNLLVSVLGFCCFALASSSVYVLNDIVDAEQDKLHPKKRFRPIPAGVLSKPAAWVYLIVLTSVWVSASLILSRTFAAVLVAYFAMNIAYSFFLKHVFVLDAMTIAFGFVLRALGGAVLIHVPFSPWLFVCTVLLSLFLALGKRRSELTFAQVGHRRVLTMYTTALIDQFLATLSGAVILAYSLYTFLASPQHEIMWTIPFVIYGLFRYSYLVHQTDLSGSPEEALLSDRPLLLCLVLWSITIVVLMYL